jgi:hypothetical protein
MLPNESGMEPRAAGSRGQGGDQSTVLAAASALSRLTGDLGEPLSPLDLILAHFFISSMGKVGLEIPKVSANPDLGESFIAEAKDGMGEGTAVPQSGWLY